MQSIHNFLVGLILHRDCRFIPSRIERLYVVVLHFDLQNRIEVQDAFVFAADLEILVDHPCDLPSREKAFLSLCSLFLSENSSFEVSVEDLLETTRCFRIKTLEVCVQVGTVDGIQHLQMGSRASGSISLIHTIVSIGRLAHEDTSLLKYLRQMLKFLNSSVGSSPRTSEPCVAVGVSPRHAVIFVNW